MRRDYKREGFSLIEIMVGMLLIGSIFTFSYPVISEHLTARRVKNEAGRLRISIENASLTAVQEERDLELLLSKYGYQLRISESCEVREKRKFVSPVHLLLDAETLVLNFYGSGVSTPASLSITDGSTTCKVILSLRGRVRMEC